MRTVLLGALISILAGASAHAGEGSKSPLDSIKKAQAVRKAKSSEVQLITKAVHDSDLRDPMSAQLRRVVVGKNADGTGMHFCGEFNAKNAYGAYVGFKPFMGMVFDDEAFILSLGLNDVSELTVTQMCAARGLSPR